MVLRTEQCKQQAEASEFMDLTILSRDKTQRMIHTNKQDTGNVEQDWRHEGNKSGKGQGRSCKGTLVNPCTAMKYITKNNCVKTILEVCK